MVDDRNNLIFDILHNEKRKVIYSSSKVFDKIHNEKKKNSPIDVLHNLDAKTIAKEMCNYDVTLKIKTENEIRASVKLEPIVKEFLENHKTFSYMMHTENISNFDKNSSIKISPKDLKMYFRNIVIKNLPTKLFGTSKNREQFVKMIGNYLRLAKAEVLKLPDFVLKMNLSQVIWLEEIREEKTKKVLFLKCLKWLVKCYIDKIIDNQFYVTEAFLGSNQKVFMRHIDWHNNRQKHFRKMNVKKIEKKKEDPPKKLFFNAKPSGLRPIIINCKKPSAYKKRFQQTLNRFLNQRLLKNFNKCNQDFTVQWLQIRNGGSKFGNNTDNLYMISCDIKDAFGSINLGILYRIIEELCEDLPEILKYVQFIKTTQYGTIWKHWFIDKKYFELPKTIGKYKQSSRSDWINTNLILQEIKNYIFNFNFRFRNGEMYKLTQGVAQGGSLSAVLSEIYYLYMTEELMKPFIDKGILNKFADDYFFVTNDKELAKQFVKQIKQGFPKYNCKFNQNKTKTNFDLGTMVLTGDSVPYLNTLINSKTLDTEPIYTVLPRYSVCLTKKSSDKPEVIAQHFSRRLWNIGSLKLEELYLTSFNSEEVILRTVKRAALFQARKCLTLFSLLPRFTNFPKELLRPTKHVINKANKYFIKRIEQLRPDFTPEMLKKVKSILWNAYKSIFKTRPEVYNIFNKFIETKLRLLLWHKVV